MSERKYNRKLAAILSADVKDYSRLMSLDDAQTVTTLKTHREIIGRLCVSYSGRVIDSPGDNILAEFASVVEAVTCALEIQDEINNNNSSLPTDRQMVFRIGINLGDVIEDEDRLYGDGVNIAARLEALATGGGICISGNAYDQIQNKLQVGCEFIGEQVVKNIAKPIPVYRIWKDPESTSCTVPPLEQTNNRKLILASASGVFAVLVAAFFFYHEKIPFLSKPNPDANQYAQRTSIAVLPFQNLSDDPLQAYLSDGITNDIITDLSKFTGLAVPASNTVFRYKGKYPDIKKVGRELNVKYVLEGSVQKSGEHIRVNVQLIDAASGNHIWADRFSHKAKDIFKLQDEIISTTVRKLALKVHQSELALAMKKDTENLKAYDYYLQAYHHFFLRGRENIATARQFFEKAIEIDPDYASAYVGLAKTRTWAVNYGYTEFPNIVLQEALKTAKKADQLDGSNASAHAELGYIYMRFGEYDIAKRELQKAIDLNPNDWISYRHMGAVMLYAGDPDAALKWYKKVREYDPYLSPGVYMNMGIAHYLKGNDDRAIYWLKEATIKWPTFLGCHILLASIYGNANEKEKAAHEKEKVLSLSPFFKIDFYGQAYQIPDHREKIVTGLRKAGLT